MTTKDTTNCLAQSFISVLPLLQLPNGVLQHGVTKWLSLSDCASLGISSKDLKAAVEAALDARTSWHCSEHHEVSHLKASRLFKYLARHSPKLTHISCCFAADRLYGGSLLENSLSILAAAVTHLTHLTLLNVDITDAVLHALARNCTQLQHIAIGRTGHNAFGNFVSDDGLAALARSCEKLSSLCLFRCYSCSDAGLRELVAQGRRIKTLVLHSCPQVTHSGLVSFFEGCPGLEQLDVLLPESASGGSAVNFEACFALAANCSDLKVLRLSEELMTGSVLNDACMTVIARGCCKLQELELVQVEISDTSLTAVAQYCTELTSLYLEQTYVGDEGIRQVIAACKRLQTLRVAGCSTHSWMLPAEYMFAGLSIAGLKKLQPVVAQQPAVGGDLTSLDLSCLVVEPAEETETVATAVAAAAAAAAAVAPTGLVLPPIAANSAAVPAATSSSSSCYHLQEDLKSGHQLLLPEPWCRQLTHLSLDWLKADGDLLQDPLTATLSRCSHLTKLSLIGYQGNVDKLLAAVAAAAGRGLVHLNLQHTQVTDAGLAAAVAAFPKLSSLHLGYCRHLGDQGLNEVLNLNCLEELDLFNTPCVSAAVVATIARRAASLQRLYIGHNTSALHRSPAALTAMGYITGRTAGGNYATVSSSVWSAVNEAVAARVGPRVIVTCRNPSQDSEFEKRALEKIMSKHSQSEQCI